MDHDVVAVSFHAAAAGDQGAWNKIVERYAGLVWAVARSFRLSSADAADVSQAAWLRLVERIDQVRDAQALGSWLATTTRNEAVNLMRKRRDVPVAEFDATAMPGEEQEDPSYGVVTAARDEELWQAFRRLPARCQEILRVLVVEPADGYAAAAAALGMPIGSLGPSRSRCLASLRNDLHHSGREGAASDHE
ncbi:sigma-70 family RNA polymerase sigma factor [Actinoplanes sp. NPDC051411]|uniref:RNA polymerase sigma factor n=1 Tax=Actinoplanes sp. NPDC051411 TaxID=3155522 RepID=UPI00343AF169